MNHTFRAIAITVVPEAAGLDDDGWRDLEHIIEHAIAQRPCRMQRQLRIFVRLLDLMSIVHNRRRLHRLPPAKRTVFLDAVQNSTLRLMRRGFWGVRTLVLMGYYARPEARAAIGYRADARGWEARV